MSEGPGRPAFSPRVSAILPTSTGEADVDAWGVQFNLPFSKQTGDWYWHWNGGFTWLPRAESLTVDDQIGSRVDLMSPFLAGSGIYRVRQMFNLMLESVLRFDELTGDGTQTERQTAFVLSPGFRGGWNVGEQQIIVGAAVPVTWVDGGTETGLILYLSYELPFKKQ